MAHDGMGTTRRGAAALWPAAGAALAALAVYLYTLAPSIAFGDSPELTAAAYLAGVPHPTGYPLYMLLGHAFTRWFPFGSVAYRMNLLSAVAAALAVFLIALLGARVTRSRAAGVLAALLFAFSRTFWSQAVIAEVYALHLAFVAGVLVCVTAWDARGDRRWLLAAAAAYGFSFTHHLTSILLAPALLYFALTSRHRPQFLRELRWALPLFLAPALLYAYLPLVAARNPDANWGDPAGWRNFLYHVTGRQYADLMFHSGWRGLWAHLAQYAGPAAGATPGYLQSQVPVWLLPLAGAGLFRLFRTRRRLFGLTVGVYLAVVYWSLNYSIFDIDVYYLAAHLMVMLWIAVGARWIAGWASARSRKLGTAGHAVRWTRAAPALLALALPGLALASNWRANDQHEAWSTLVNGRGVLDALKPNALLIAVGDTWHFPLLYTRFVEKRRPDVSVIGLQDLVIPAAVRRVERLARSGVRVRVPAGYTHSPRPYLFDPRLLEQVLADNVGRRPVYVLDEASRLLSDPAASAALAPYTRIASSNAPLTEFHRGTPPLDREPPVDRAGEPVAFGRRGRNGSVSHDVELLGCRVEPAGESAAPWLRVRYYWNARRPAAARGLQVLAMFADAEGNYQRSPSGSADFHNDHPLGQQTFGPARELRGAFCETFRLYVPPSCWNRSLYLWVALADGDRFLPISGRPGKYTRLSEIPRVTTGGSGVRLVESGSWRAAR